MLLLSPWLWFDDGNGGGSWGPPSHCHGSIDLAGAAQISEARPGQPRDWGLFLCDDIPIDLTEMGGIVLSDEDPRDARPGGKLLDAWESILGRRPEGDTLADLVWDQFTHGADPSNPERNGMLVPDADGRLQLWLGGLIREEPFVYGRHPHTEKLKSLIQRQLESARTAARDGKLIDPVTRQPDFEYHRKIADAMAEKYAGKNESSKADLFAELKPQSWLSNEGPLTHATTITDDFTRANTAGVIGNLLTWAQILNALDTVSNAVANGGSGVSNDGRGRAESDLSSSDNYGQAALTTGTNTSRGCGVSCRNNASNDECYSVTVLGSSGANVWNLYKVNSSGTKTLIGAGPTATYSTAAKVQASGSTIGAYNNGSLVESVTDTTYTTGTRCGIIVLARNSADPPRVDNFEAGDLAAVLNNPRLERGIRGMNRGLS
jgi:hypothetical protein